MIACGGSVQGLKPATFGHKQNIVWDQSNIRNLPFDHGLVIHGNFIPLFTLGRRIPAQDHNVAPFGNTVHIAGQGQCFKYRRVLTSIAQHVSTGARDGSQDVNEFGLLDRNSITRIKEDIGIMSSPVSTSFRIFKVNDCPLAEGFTATCSGAFGKVGALARSPPAI